MVRTLNLNEEIPPNRELHFTDVPAGLRKSCSSFLRQIACKLTALLTICAKIHDKGATIHGKSYLYSAAAVLTIQGRRLPFSAFVSGVDFSGDGTSSDLLPGTKVNQFNRAADRNDLARAVETYNREYSVSAPLEARSRHG